MSDEPGWGTPEWCKARAREGAQALASRAAGPKTKTLTDVESAAIDRARARIDERGNP